jgi:hypothetical protein
MFGEKRRLREENARLRKDLDAGHAALGRLLREARDMRDVLSAKDLRIADLEVLLGSAQTAIRGVQDIVGRLPPEADDAAS